MNEILLEKIDRLIDESRSEVVDLTIKLVNINSVLDTAAPGAPFGKGARKVLDTVIEEGKADGLYTTDYNVGVVSVGMKEGQPDLGIWAHGDVVPAGDDWNFEPYNAVEYEGLVIGRGASDNKGPIAAMCVLLKLLKDNNIDLKFNPALYVGSCEEKGMFDLLGFEGNPDAKGFLKVCTPPKLSFIPDGKFPVSYGGNGSLTISFKTTSPLNGITLTAGQDTYPGKATAIFEGREIKTNLTDCTVTNDGKTTVDAFSLPVHNAYPNPDNMIAKLSRGLLECDVLSKEERLVFEFLGKMASDITGKTFGIDVDSEDMHPLSLSTYKIDAVDGYAEVFVNLRYPVQITHTEIMEKMNEVSEKYGFKLSGYTLAHKPYRRDKNSEIVKLLYRIANEGTGSNELPYSSVWATYAHELPNAYVFGSSASSRLESWEKGRGGAHGIDEAVSIDCLLRMMKIYARAFLELNEMDW